MVLVKIKCGLLRGKIIVDKNNEKFYSFQNIPYAEPPLGKLRFQAPRPIQPWNGVKDATEQGNECISRHQITKQIVGSEDCLNLNVYTPEIKNKNSRQYLRPVMFWIHGGAFMTGSNKTELFGPEYLIAENVVIVTINYRLGFLGFLSLDDPLLGVPGNAGLKDMVMALKWVQENISQFCGDPNNVTIFGESAGAAAVHFLMLSPMAKGLFHKAIAQSACALHSWAMGRRSARAIAKNLGFYNSDDKKILDFLQNVSPFELLNAQYSLDCDDFGENYFRVFGAVVERSSIEEAFFSERPIDIILSGRYNHVPFIIGYNEREGMAIDKTVPPKTKNSFFQNLELSVPLNLNIQRGSSLSKNIANKIRDFYFDGMEERNREQHLVQYCDMTTDTSFLRDIYISVRCHLKTSTKPIYFYKMTLETELNIFKKLIGIKVPGMYHGDDLGYLFKTMFSPEICPGSVEDIAQKRIAKLWTNFAHFGNPTPHSNDHLLEVIWKPVTHSCMNYLQIGEKISMKQNPEHERMEFWMNIYKNTSLFSKL